MARDYPEFDRDEHEKEKQELYIMISEFDVPEFSNFEKPSTSRPILHERPSRPTLREERGRARQASQAQPILPSPPRFSAAPSLPAVIPRQAAPSRQPASSQPSRHRVPQSEGSSQPIPQDKYDERFDDKQFPGYYWSLVVACPHREWETMIQHRLVQDKRGNIFYERRHLSIEGREKDMLILINLKNFLRIRDDVGTDLNHYLLNQPRLNQARGILNSQLTRDWIQKAIRGLCGYRALVKTRQEYTVDFICGMAEVHAKWFHSLMDRDDRREFGASLRARTAYITRTKELLPAFVMGQEGGRILPIPARREGWPFENDEMLMCKPRGATVSFLGKILDKMDMHAQTN